SLMYTLLTSFPTRRSSDLPVTDFSNYTFKWYTGSVADESQRIPDSDEIQLLPNLAGGHYTLQVEEISLKCPSVAVPVQVLDVLRSEEHTSELQSRENLVCR